MAVYVYHVCKCVSGYAEHMREMLVLLLTPRFLMALFRSWTTSIPSTPLALNRLVQVSKTALCRTNNRAL